MNFSLLYSLVEDVCVEHNLHLDEVDVVLERDFSTGKLSNVVVTAEKRNPIRLITISIKGDVKDD